MELILLFSLILQVANGCPRTETIEPCICNVAKGYDAEELVCSEIYSEEDIIRVASASRNHKKLEKFAIVNSVLNYVPEEAFEGTLFKLIEIENSSLAALSNTDSAFKGLEEHLTIFSIKNCMFLSEWEWDKLENLHALTWIEISGSGMPTIEEDINKVNNLTHINFTNNAISWIDENALSNFSRLILLVLSGNKISIVKRHMFPKSAPKFRFLDLSHNLIEQLPPDLFTDMPSLQLLTLNNNKILTLNEDTFSPIWEQLTFLEATGNDLRCDCRLSWMLRKKELYSLRAFCAEPLALKGKDLRELKAIDLWC